MIILRKVVFKKGENKIMANLNLQLKDYRLTTAEIIYCLPDHPRLLQSFLWQNYDLAPSFPELKKFLHFWEREIEGRLHSVHVGHKALITPSEFGYNQSTWTIN
jgi:uncharacterized protein Usg